MDWAERLDHKYTIPTYELPIVLELSTLEVHPPRNGKSRDSRLVTSQAMSRRAGRSTPAAAHRDAAAFLLREWEGWDVSRVMDSVPKLQSCLSVGVENSDQKRRWEWKMWRKMWDKLDWCRKLWWFQWTMALVAVLWQSLMPNHQLRVRN